MNNTDLGKLVFTSNEQERDFLLTLSLWVEQDISERVARREQSVVHDWSHARSVALRAAEFIRGEGGSAHLQFLGFLAGLFHDFVRPPELLAKSRGHSENHEVVCAEQAVRVLREKGLPESDLEVVKAAILGHSFGLSVHESDRKVLDSSGLVSEALKAADKERQLLSSIVWERNIFLGESFSIEPSLDEVIAYYWKRINKARDFLGTPAGKLLLKYNAFIPVSFQFVIDFAHELEAEKRLIEKHTESLPFFKVVGAVGIFRAGFDTGRMGKGAHEAINLYKKRNNEFNDKFKGKSLPKEIVGPHQFSEMFLEQCVKDSC